MGQSIPGIQEPDGDCELIVQNKKRVCKTKQKGLYIPLKTATTKDFKHNSLKPATTLIFSLAACIRIFVHPSVISFKIQ